MSRGRHSYFKLRVGGINCPACGAETGVKESRDVTHSDLGGMVRRRRICKRCGKRFNTLEIEQSLFDILSGEVEDGEE